MGSDVRVDRIGTSHSQDTRSPCPCGETWGPEGSHRTPPRLRDKQPVRDTGPWVGTRPTGDDERWRCREKLRTGKQTSGGGEDFPETHRKWGKNKWFRKKKKLRKFSEPSYPTHVSHKNVLPRLSLGERFPRHKDGESDTEAPFPPPGNGATPQVYKYHPDLDDCVRRLDSPGVYGKKLFYEPPVPGVRTNRRGQTSPKERPLHPSYSIRAK